MTEHFMKRLMIGGTQSGCGKTTVTAAVLAALTARKMKLAPYKCGPDYIDPMFHRRITGRPSINLDSVFLEPEKLRKIFAWHMKESDMAVIEGVMGYYDGQGKGDRGSSYHVASITKTPAVLVVRPEGTALSAAAIVQGFKNFREESMLRGIILNGIREGMYPFYREMIEAETGLKVYGFLPKESNVFLESRHLGLVTAAKLVLLGAMAEKYIDLDGLIGLAGTAEPFEPMNAFEEFPTMGNVRLAVALDEAFCFYYEDNLEMLRRFGAEIIPFSPLRDACLPEHIHGIYIGGGYPEIYAERLSENESMRMDILRAGRRGLPIIGECGGYMYLCGSIQSRPMVGLVPGKCRMTEKLGPFGYVRGTCRKDSLIGKAGETFAAHEFHYSLMADGGEDFLLSKPGRRSWSGGTAGGNIYAAYPHLYFYANPEIPKRFMGAMEAFRQAEQTAALIIQPGPVMEEKI